MPSITLPNGQSSVLLSTGFNLSFPPGAVVLGFLLSVTGSQSSQAAGASLVAQAIGGTEANAFTLPATEGVVPLGSPVDDWNGGEGWNWKQVNTPGFGFGIKAINSSGSSVTFEIDSVNVQPFYAIPAPSALVVCPLCRWIQNIYQPPSVILDVEKTPLIYG